MEQFFQRLVTIFTMKIAQVAPLYESVPPKLYGGTERIVYYLTEELVRLGHEVTLFAAGDSKTSAALVPCIDEALRLNEDCEESLAPHILQLQQVMQQAEQFDLIHLHTGYIGFPFSKKIQTPHVTTMHGKLNIPELQFVYNQFPDPLISISDNQRKPLPNGNFMGTVYHGIPRNLHPCGEGRGGYLAFLGRISPEKGIDTAIEWAMAANQPLKVAAKVDKADQAYFDEKIKHLLDHPLIEFIGEINEKEKSRFLGEATALLFPINWNEPFGLVMIEAMACGTPVVAHCMGSVPEIIEDGKTGFIVSNTSEAVQVIHQVHHCDRREVRRQFELRFTAERMATDYVELYKKLISAHATSQGPADEVPIYLETQ